MGVGKVLRDFGGALIQWDKVTQIPWEKGINVFHSNNGVLDEQKNYVLQVTSNLVPLIILSAFQVNQVGIDEMEPCFVGGLI